MPWHANWHWHDKCAIVVMYWVRLWMVCNRRTQGVEHLACLYIVLLVHMPSCGFGWFPSSGKQARNYVFLLISWSCLWKPEL